MAETPDDPDAAERTCVAEVLAKAATRLPCEVSSAALIRAERDARERHLRRLAMHDDDAAGH